MYNYRSPLGDDYEEPQAHFPPPPRMFPLRGRPPLGRQRPDSGPYPRPIFRPDAPRPKYSGRYQMPSYPKELNDKFGALECKLCSVEASSPITAKMHYSGKPHMKKVKSFLTEWSLKTGNPMPQLDQDTSTSSISSFPDYCELCNVRTISSSDKMLHYTGKTHKKNELDPANAKKRGNIYSSPPDPTGRFGIGAGFSMAGEVSETKVDDFSCDVCGIKTISQEQLTVHLGGKKHKEKLQKKEAGVPKPERKYKCDICEVSLETLYLLNLHLQGKPHAKTLYKLELEFKPGPCEICGIESNSYKDYQIHLKGKRHEKKLNQLAVKTPETIKDQREVITCRKCPYVGDLDKHECDKSLENNKSELDGKWVCKPCYDASFETEEEFVKHKETRRHLLCMLNVEGDKIIVDKIFFYCFTCRKQYNDRREYTEHLFTHKHMTLSDPNCDLSHRDDMWYCPVCAILIDKVAKQDHDKSKHHLMLEAQLDLTNTLTELATAPDLYSRSFYCSHCAIKFYNFKAFSDHMLEPSHVEDLVCNRIMPALDEQC